MTVVHNDAHIHEQFLYMNIGLGLVFPDQSVPCRSSPLFAVLDFNSAQRDNDCNSFS